MNGKRTLRRLAAIGLGLALGLVAAEVLVRAVLDPHGAMRDDARAKLPRWAVLCEAGLLQSEAAGDLRLSLTPGFEGTIEEVRYRTNSLGLRGPEVEPKSEGARRILLVGDSYAYGLGVAEVATVEAHLAELLTAAGQPTEVLNLGVPTHHTGQELAWLQRVGPALEADLVVLLYFGNDASEPGYHVDPATGLPYTDELGLPHAWKLRLWSSSLYALAARSSAERYADSGAFTAGAGVTWPTVRARLEAFADHCDSAGLPLVVANLPTIRPGATTRDAEAYAPDLDDHLTGDGNRLVAERIAQAMAAPGGG